MNDMKRKKNLVMKQNGIVVLLLFLIIGVFSCKDNYEGPIKDIYPPSEGVETSITSYFPDTGGIATKIVLYGSNFGTDTSYLKVTVNGNNAAIIGSDGKSILAVVPARADTGLVKVLVGKEPDIKEFTYPIEFKYQFKRNVTTEFGLNGQKGIEDGTYREAKLRRPWFVLTDDDGVIYSIDEGRGLDKDGGLRRAYEGNVTTLKRNFGGPFQSPTAMAFSPDQDTLYVVNSLWDANSMNTDAAIAIFLRETGFTEVKTFVRAFRTKCTAVAVHPQNGDLFLNSQNDGYIYKYNKETSELEPQFQVNGTDTELRMLFSRDGKTVYIVVKNKHCVYRADYNPTTRKIENPRLWLGEWNQKDFKNGMTVTARFNEPGQPAEDDKGNLYIPDKHNHCIRVVSPEGVVSTYAGMPKSEGYLDGEPLEAKFKQPEAVCFSPDMAMYVADRENQVIRRILVE